MSDPSLQVELLSREEMDALFGALAEERAESERREQGAAHLSGEARRRARGRRGRLPALERAFESFAQRHARSLSLAHQRRVGVTLLGVEELRREEFAATLLASDRLVAFELAPGAERAHLLFGRPFFFTLLALACGARPGGCSRIPLPRRPYTRIEERFLRRLAEPLLEQLGRALGDLVPGTLRSVGIEDPETLADDGGVPLLLASYDIAGLGELCRLRLALPLAAFERPGVAPAEPARGATRAAAAAQPAEFGAALLDMPVSLRIEVGAVDVSLARLSTLRPGDTLALERPEGGGLVVKVEGAAKFRAMRGALGKRLAVQVTERL